MIITKQTTENDILRTNIHYYWNNFSESEQKWLMDHIALEQDKTLIYRIMKTATSLVWQMQVKTITFAFQTY